MSVLASPVLAAAATAAAPCLAASPASPVASSLASSPVSPLVIQIGLGLLMVGIWTRLVLPLLRRPGHTPMLTDLWLPMAIALPAVLSMLAVRIEADPAGRGLVSVLPLAGMLGGGAALLGGGRRGWDDAAALGRSAASPTGGLLPGPPPSTLPGSGLAWIFAGLVMVLLAALHQLPIWVGQTIFAFAIGLMWVMLGEPEAPAPGDDEDLDRRRAGSSLGALIVLSLGVVQWLAGPVGPGWLEPPLLTTAALLLVTVAAATPPIGMRLAGWTATMAVLFGLGGLSLEHLVREGLGAAGGRVPEILVATGFGHFAPEGMVLIGLGGLAVAAEALRPAARRGIGAIVGLLGAAVLVRGVLLGLPAAAG